MHDDLTRRWEVWPYERVDSGASNETDDTYDLDRWNEEYWNRFDRFLEATRDRDVVVQVELWAPWDFHPDEDWQRNPYNPANNCNYSFEESGLPERSSPRPGVELEHLLLERPGPRRFRRRPSLPETVR